MPSPGQLSGEGERDQLVLLLVLVVLQAKLFVDLEPHGPLEALERRVCLSGFEVPLRNPGCGAVECSRHHGRAEAAHGHQEPVAGLDEGGNAQAVREPRLVERSQPPTYGPFDEVAQRPGPSSGPGVAQEPRCPVHDQAGAYLISVLASLHPDPAVRSPGADARGAIILQTRRRGRVRPKLAKGGHQLLRGLPVRLQVPRKRERLGESFDADVPHLCPAGKPLTAPMEELDVGVHQPVAETRLVGVTVIGGAHELKIVMDERRVRIRRRHRHPLPRRFLTRGPDPIRVGWDQPDLPLPEAVHAPARRLGALDADAGDVPTHELNEPLQRGPHSRLRSLRLVHPTISSRPRITLAFAAGQGW